MLWSTRSLGFSPMLVATLLKSPPSISVALVNTTVLSVSSLSRSGPQTWSGATHSWLPPRLRSRSASHSTSLSRWAAIRSAVLNSSCTQPRAWVRPGSGSPPSPPEDSFGNAEISARAASRTSSSASERSVGTVSIRPGGQPSIASRRASAASESSSASEPSMCFCERRAARSISG